MIKSILNTFAFNLNYARMLVADLEPSQMSSQPVADMNHAAWVLGHLAVSADHGCAMLGAEPKLPEDWQRLFGNGSTPTSDADYPDKDTLLEALEDAHTRLAGALESADPQVLEQQMPNEAFRKVMPTIGDGLVFLATSHESTHLGQLSAWRRALRLPPVLSA